MEAHPELFIAFPHHHCYVQSTIVVIASLFSKLTQAHDDPNDGTSYDLFPTRSSAVSAPF